MVPAAGVEPATFRSGGERSNPLSYAGLNKIAGFKEKDQKRPLFCPLFCTPFCTPRQSGGAGVLVTRSEDSMRFSSLLLGSKQCSHTPHVLCHASFHCGSAADSFINQCTVVMEARIGK